MSVSSSKSVPLYCSDDGFWFSWGFQAWFDYLCVRSMYKTVGKIVPNTLVPIIQLSCGEPDKVFTQYETLIEQHNENIRWNESPRQKWRKLYGNLTRELEWGISEVYRYIPAKSADKVLVDTMAHQMGAGALTIKRLLYRIFKEPPAKTIADPALNAKKLKSAQRFFRIFNPVYFIVGDVDIEEVDMGAGSIKMTVSDCAYLRAARMDKLPEHGCLQFCKGSCEQVFGPDDPIKLVLEPDLPETTCTIRAYWKHRSVEGAA